MQLAFHTHEKHSESTHTWGQCLRLPPYLALRLTQPPPYSTYAATITWSWISSKVSEKSHSWTSFNQFQGIGQLWHHIYPESVYGLMATARCCILGSVSAHVISRKWLGYASVLHHVRGRGPSGQSELSVSLDQLIVQTSNLHHST